MAFAAAIVIWVVGTSYLNFYGVHVSEVDYTDLDGTCGLTTATANGFVAGADNEVSSSVSMGNANSSAPCRVTSVQTSTPGFSMTGSDTPFTIPVGGHYELSYTFTTPHTYYTGPLEIEVR